MATTGIRISQLPSQDVLTNDDVFVVNNANADTKRITYSDLANNLSTTVAPVTSVNGQTGVVEITANNLGVYTKGEVDSKVSGYATNALLGVINGSSNLGVFPGSTISPESSVRQALQELETAVEAGDAQDAILNGDNTYTGTNSFQGGILAPAQTQDGQNAINLIAFFYENQAAFPSATTYHGAIAHSHDDGKMYYAHAGAWEELANASEIFSGEYGNLLNAPTLGSAAAEDVSAFATSTQGATADSAVQQGTSGVTEAGTAAGAAIEDFATAAQGLLAASAIQKTSNAITETSLSEDGTATAADIATAINNLTQELSLLLNA